MDALTRDDLEALASQHLSRVVPGRITSIRLSPTMIIVDSSLDSPFSDHTPSRWGTYIDRATGDTLSCDVVEKSVPR